MAEKYYNLSPYAYCANNPVSFVDPDGEFPLASNLLGAVLSVAVEYDCQVAANTIIESEATANLLEKNIKKGAKSIGKKTSLL